MDARPSIIATSCDRTAATAGGRRLGMMTDDCPRPPVPGKTRILSVGMVILATAGCIYPPPMPELESRLGLPPEGKAVLHAYIAAEDPFGIMPSNQKCAVAQVDEQVWSREMRQAADNRIVIEPGLHWVKIEVDLLLAKPSWVAFELDFEPGHEYSLADTLTGCHALLGIGKNRVIDYPVPIADYAGGGLVEVLKLGGYCANARGGIGCREDTDCASGLQCVATGKTGLGLCGDRPGK